MPVLSGAARGFATFDHWFCEVPSCTFPNRSFFHAGTSSGYVINLPPADAFLVHNTAETLFDRLDAAGLTWRVYCSPPAHFSLTGIIHAAGYFILNAWISHLFCNVACGGPARRGSA